MKHRRSLAVNLLAIALLLLISRPVFSAELIGLPVTSLLFVGDRGEPWPHAEQLSSLCEVRPGALLSRDDVRRGIKYLYLKGSFRDIRVEGFPDGQGVRLRYMLFPLVTVSNVVISGNDALSRRAIRNIAGRMEGKEPREEKAAALRTEIQDLYQSAGYYDSRVDVHTEPSDEPNRVELHIDIQEGAPAIIEKVIFSGNTHVPDAQLAGLMKNRAGTPYRRDLLLDADLTKVRNAYAERGRPAARTGPVTTRFRNGRVFVDVQVVEGPKVEESFSGNTAFSDRDLRGLLLIREEHDASEAVIESSAHRIERAYREAGYADASVNVRTARSGDRMEIEFAVREGMRVTVGEVRFEGNRAFSAKELARDLPIATGGWFRSASYREDLVDDARDAIRGKYVEAGYTDASVERTVERSEDGKRATIVFRIAEGGRRLVKQVSFAGNEALSDSELIAVINMRSGSPFSERVMDEDRYRILAAYAHAGYLYARAEAQTRTENGAVTVTYAVTEDRPVRIGKIILRGNERTEDRVIMRELRVKEGDVYDYSEVLKSQQQVYRLGFLRLARFEPLNPGARERVKDMLLTVEERPAGVMEFTVGYGSLDRLRGSAQVSYRNLWGTAKTASFRVEASDILQEAILDYREPWLFERRLEWRTRFAWSDTKRINSDTREIYYQTRKSEASTGIEKVYEAMKLSLVYQYENVENYDVSPGAILSRDDEGRVLVSSLTPGAILDLRDDPFNPRKGSLHGLAVKEASKLLGSEAYFTKATFQTSWFLPGTGTSIAAVSLRAGRAWPHGTTALGDPQEVPLHERFYLGGGSTVRGFQQDLVGPQSVNPDGTRTPTGGDRMVLLNAELRIGKMEGLGIVLFTDSGNVWNKKAIDRHDLRASYGIGIRYQTPVGPLRVDYGQKMNRKGTMYLPPAVPGGTPQIIPGESPGELHFNIGHSF